MVSASTRVGVLYTLHFFLSVVYRWSCHSHWGRVIAFVFWPKILDTLAAWRLLSRVRVLYSLLCLFVYPPMFLYLISFLLFMSLLFLWSVLVLEVLFLGFCSILFIPLFSRMVLSFCSCSGDWILPFLLPAVHILCLSVLYSIAFILVTSLHIVYLFPYTPCVDFHRWYPFDCRVCMFLYDEFPCYHM